MSVNELMQFAGQIEMLTLPEEEKEQLMVQAADLIRFKESFSGKLELAKLFNPGVSIVTTAIGTAGIVFCSAHDKMPGKYVLKEPQHFKQLKKVQEMWLVFVAGPQETCLKRLEQIMTDYNVKKHYGKVFYLNFFSRDIQTL